MINQDKQYIVVSNGETYRFSDADWTANKDEFMKDNPSAEIAEVDRYSVDDSQEGDFISVMAGGQSYGFNVNDWNANQEEFLKDFPDAQPYRMRGVDYHYNQALSLEEALADNKKRKEAWEARRKEGMSGASLAEIAALEAGLDPIIGTFSEGAGAAKAYLDEGRQIEEERIRLQEQYDNNPRVKEAQEKWEKEQAEYKAQYPQLLREQVNKDYQDFLSTVPQADRQVTLGGDPEGFNEIGRATKMLFGSEEQRNQQAMYDSNNPLFVQALTYIDEADKIANAPSVADETNGFVKYLKTMGDRFSETDFWSRGLYEADALAKGGNAALTKFQQIADEKGDNLTEEDINAALSPAEKAFVLALTHKIAVQAERANEFASDDVKLSRAYNLGRGTADMVGYMAEFLLSGSLSGGASKTATNAVAKWLIKNGVSRLTRSALKGTAGKAAVKAISKNALKGASKVLTNILSKSAGAVVGGAARTPFTLSLAGNIADRRTSVDENGRFHDIGESAIYGTFDTAVENFSEEMGGAVGDLLGVPFKAGKGAWKAMTRNVDFGKIGGVAAKAGDFAQRVANSKAFAFLKNAGFHGPLEEVGEEFVGAAVRDVTIEPEAWEQTANKESVIDLMVTFAPMTALGMAGTAGQMIHVSNEAKSKMEKLSQLMLAKGFDQKRVDYITDYMRSTTPEKLRQEMVGIWTKMANESGLGANVMQSEIGKAVIEAAYATAQYQTLFGAKQAQEAQQREAKKAELEEKYNGKFYGEDGMVRRHTLSNGKTVFQISNFGENGEAAAIDAKTGEHIVFKESDIAVETDKEGKQHKRSDSQTLDSYLSGEVMALNTTWEYARMQKDRQDQINALAQSLPAAINLGTQGDSKMAPVKEYNAQGVTVVDENGDEIALTWEQVGQKLGKPIKVLTDAEIAEIEAQEIAMRSNERKAGRAQTQQEVADTEAEINDTNKRIADLTPNPEEAYRNQETGEIDEDAFWDNDPEGWADYNDRMMMDNGQDSMEQIESGLTLLAKQMSELDKMKSDSPNARKTIKAQKANLQAKIDRLVALQQKYVQASISEEQRKVELTLALRERVAEWRKRLGLNEEGLIVFESIEDVINSPYLSEKEKADVLEVIGRGKTEGWYNTASTRAFVFLPDINTAEELDKTIAHEVVTHYGLHNLMGEKAYNELMDKVWDTMSDAARNAYYNYAGVASMQDADKRRRAAAEEFVASIAENVSLDQATAEQKSIWQRIVEFFRNLFKESNFSDLDIADIVRKNYQQLTEQAAQESVEEFKAEAQEQRENGIIPELIETEAQQADGTKLYSTATYHSWVDNLGHEHTGTREEVLTRMQNMGFSEAEIEDMAQRMDTAYAYMEKLRRLTNPDGTVRFDEFNKWAEKTPLYKQIGRDYVKAITSLVSNGDYPVNLEITTDCIKREAFTQLLNELVKRGAELSGMGPGEIVTIQKMMKQYGIEVACNLCFVEGKRLQIINWASQIVNDWNDALVEAGVETDEFFEFGKDGDAFIPADEWRTYEDKSKVAKVMRNLDDIALLFQGLDPKTFKAQKRKNKKALDKYIKEKAEKAKKPVDQWKPSDEQKREMKKIANEGLYPTYVNENMEEYRNAFNAMRNEWLDKNPNADPLSFNPTQKQWEALGKIRNRQIDNVRAKMVRLIMEYPEMRKKMTLNDLLGSKGLMEIRQQHGQAYADLYSIILQRFGTGTPKPVQDAVPYDGEVMTLSESAFKKANEIGGARLFSFSDFDITKVFDYMQMFFDLEANRQMLQSYTKEVAAVLIFGRSNAKFNISTLANAIVPDSVKEEYNKASEEKKQELRHKWAEYAGLEVDAEGNIIGINFSEEHSVSPAFAQQIFHDDSRNKDCGAIMVGASVNHAIFSAAQQWIRMVIPFHLSGMPMAAREKTDVKWYTDNTAYQSTRKKTKDGWSKISSSEDTFKFYNDMNKEGWNMRDKTREYLAWCAEKGFRPKFDWGINSDYYRAYCEENGYTPNQQIIDMMDADTTDGVWNQYYKFLTDFTAYKPVFNEQGEMIDEIPSPQLPVQSNFDFSEMEKDVLFEGERSMLEHREGNIQRTYRHIEILAEQATAYLNGDITEEEMGLRDDVHFENTADAERYLEEVAKENGTNMYKTRTDSEREKLFADAKEKFGVTNNFKVAGYMLPDGSLLDFSEANDGGDPNQRSLDHRSIEDVIMEDGTEYDSRWMYLADFMNEGAIRLLPEYAGINLMKAPTKEQRQRLMDFIYKYNGEVILEIADERLNNAAYVEYDRRTSPARIFRDIDGYFNEGIVPQSNTMFKTANNNQAIFVSNAAKAVEGIKMEKATPEQWLKMIEKNGGLKAGEDKWMGLSDWLKSSDKKTLTKQEVLDFINENMIVIEETHYDINAESDAERVHGEITDKLQDRFDHYIDEYYQDKEWDDDYTDKAREYAIEKLREEMGDTFPYTIEREYGSVYLTFPYEEESDLVEWAEKTGVEYTPGVNPINDTRLGYTTDGLENRHEIALTVPTIESWNEEDDIHFGDAGDGRAIAWIRFGDTQIINESTVGAARRAVDEASEREREILDKRGKAESEEEYRSLYPALEEAIRAREEAVWAWNKAKKESVTKKVLVIDEIQSKRHQEGREKGYATMSAAEFSAQMNDKYGTQYFGWQDKASPEEWEKYRSLSNAIPDAPFDKNWHELAMKRMLRYAAENGYDVIAWTKGEQQTARYGLGGVVSAITMAEEHDGFIDFLFDVRGQEESSVIGVEKETGIVHLAEEPLSQAEGKPLSDLVGKEMAVRMMQMQESEVLEGANLQIGGEGMKGFYDRMLPSFMNKYGKKWGVKVEDIHLNLEGGLNMHSVPVTEEMKSSVMEGQVMFKTKHPLDSTKLFMQEVTNEFYDKYGTSAPASVVYAKSRKMVAEALGFNADTLPDWVYEKVKEEAKVSAAFLANMNIGHSDGTIENRKRILIFAKEGYNMSADVDRIIFHENIHGFVLENPELLKLGEWLSESDNKTVKRVIGWIKDAYEKDEWANEMVSDYAARMLSIGKGQMALNLIPDEYKPLLNYIYEKFGYRPEQEDGRRVAELISDAETLQMRDSKLEGADRGSNLFRTEISPEIRREMDVISAQAIVNGTYLKAPNGADTNLTPEQWAMVRTKNFLDWFGDWINDPANASKVLDENGEPMVVYHGTRQGNFTVFDTTKANKERDYTYDGIHYFTESETTANTYGDTKAAFLNIRNPYEYDFEGRSWRNDDWSGIGIMHRRSSEIIKEGFSSVEEAEKYLAHFLEEHPEYKDEEGYGAEVVTGMYVGSKGDHTDELANKARAQGYDGTVFNNVIDYEMYDEAQRDELLTPHKSFTVFSPNQIKSATDNTGEFSESEDIRFKTRTAPAPTKTQDVYKLMRLGADGKLYPLFIGSAEPIELGTWYDAESPNLGDLTKLASGVHLVNNETGEAMTLDEFKAQHPEITIKGKRPNVDAINWATENGARWIEIEDKATSQRRYEGESRSYYNLGINGSGQVGQFAMRPGWHAGSLPTMRQIGKGKDKNLRDDSFVWVKGRIPADVDYQSEADANPDKDIPTHIPTDGFYMKATNANAKASQADKMGWYVAGSFIADEIISDAEARSVIDSWNAEHPDAQVEYDYERESGREYDPKRGGLVEKEGTTLFKTTAEDYAAMPVDELVEKGKMRVSAENQLASDEFMNRIRAINGSLNQLRMAASAQRKYDKNTVQILASLANDLLASGKIADPSKGEVKRLISVLSNATGQNDLTKYVDRLMDIMIANQLRHGRENFDQFLRIRGKKVDARGVEVKGRLDIPGQQIMDAIRANIGLDLVDILFNIIETEDKLTSESETIRRNAENELIGLEFAKQYVENIRQSENEEKALRKEVKDAEAEYKAGARDRKSYTDFVKVTDEAIRENRTQRVLAYQKLIDDLAKMVASSVQGSKLFNEAEKARVAKIQHFANSDMQGMPADAHVEAESKFWNNGLVRLFTSPLATFEQWLRVFGAKSAEGKGYLYNHFMGSWAKATDQMYLGMKDANAALDAKAREVFGNKVDRWSDLFAMEKELSKGKKHTISFWDDGEMKEYEVTQGNLLYIYMVNKMIDGKMKLRKMGISEDDVDAIVREIDPRFIALADWIQEEFLPGIRDKYNAVHERLFGAPMAAIDNYFPIKVLANARVREVDLGTAESSSKPSTITGSIIKRTKNGLALDVLHSDAFDVVLEHIEQMEQWAAFAEFNRDLNTLLSYKKFRNRVQNMSGVLGAGKEAWNSFRETAEIAAGVYQPKTAKADKLVTNAVKGLTAGKISFRLWTALKQVLSMPAFFPYVTPGKMAYSMATPWKAWNWAMENLPAFEKRWKSREAGNVRLKKTEADYKIWQGDFMETATRLGMTPNAFVDAVTCAIGSQAVYLTQKERYIQDGYNEEDASAKAKADAMVAFNATQQSSESAFLSAVQSDRTFIAHALTVFRNNSFGMQRELVDALRNFKKRMKSGFKAESIEFMKKQMVRDGLTEEQAERAANRVYRNSVIKDAARVATFGFLMQFLWNIGGSAIYLLFGDDDEEKEQMIKDAAIRGAFGSIEGLGFGNVITEGMTMAVTGDLKRFHPSLSPAGQDIESLWSELLSDPVAGVNELINILVQAGIGANPQVLTDAVVAIVDACDGDIEKSKEVGIALLRILQVPQSQIDKLKTDEIDFTNDMGLDITIEEFAKEYAQYKKWRNAPLTNALYSDEKERKVEDKYIKRFLKDAEALKRTRGNEEAKDYYQYIDTEFKEIETTLRELRREQKDANQKGDKALEKQIKKEIKAIEKLPEYDVFEAAKKAEAKRRERDNGKDKDYHENDAAWLEERRKALKEIYKLGM